MIENTIIPNYYIRTNRKEKLIKGNKPFFQ